MNRKWTLYEEKFIRDNYQKMTDEEIIKALGKNVSLGTFRKKRARMGLEKKQGRIRNKVDI